VWKNEEKLKKMNKREKRKRKKRRRRRRIDCKQASKQASE
jgi:hypothetical protein